MYKKKETIFRHAPEINEADLHKIETVFSQYLIFKAEADKSRSCYCTACGEHFTVQRMVRTETPEHRAFLELRHNDATKCPKCGKQVKLKNKERLKTGASLFETERIVLCKPTSKNEVYIYGIYAERDFQSCEASPGMQSIVAWDVSTVYYTTPQTARMFKRQYDYTYLGIRDNSFYERKTIGEPFTKTISYNKKGGYTALDLEQLNKTFLKYPVNCLPTFCRNFEGWACRNPYNCNGWEVPLVKFLLLAGQNPNLEKLIKIGMGEYVCSYVQRQPMRRYINWEAKTPKEMFKMDAAKFRALREADFTAEEFKLTSEIQARTGCAMQDAIALLKRYGELMSVHLAKTMEQTEKASLRRVRRYLEEAKEPNQRAQMWVDYIRFAAELQYDLQRGDVLFPKNLQKAHDVAAENATSKADAERMEAYKTRYNALQRKYAYSTDGFSIVVPKGVADIVQEGRVLSHCVGGYAARHCEGKLTILFLRKSNALCKRLVTIELSENGKEILQQHGKGNRNLTAAEAAFTKKWIAWVQAGSKREKKTDVA